MQIVYLTGNVGKDPEEKTYGNEGKTFVTFPLAVSDWNGKEKTATWWNVSVFGQQAENVKKFVHKGSKVLVGGKPGANAYKNKLEEIVVSMNVAAHSIEFLSSKQDGTEHTDTAEPQPVPVETAELPF